MPYKVNINGMYSHSLKNIEFFPMSIKNLDNATELLIGWQNRDKTKSSDFLEHAYQGIRAIITKYLDKKSPNEIILQYVSVTELTNECLVKLHYWRNDEQPFEGRKKFFDYVRVSVWHLLFGKPPPSLVKKQLSKREFLQQDITQVVDSLPNCVQSIDLLKTLKLLKENNPKQSEIFELIDFP